MNKVFYIIITFCLLAVTAASNVQLWKCLVSGDILLDHNCEVTSVVEEDTCCSTSSSSSSTILNDDKCCEELDPATNFDLDSTQTRNSHKEITNGDHGNTLAITLFINGFVKSRVTHFHNLPPPQAKFPQPTPRYITICSFLC